MSQHIVYIPLYFWLMLIAAMVVIIARRLRLPYASALVLAGLLVGITNLLPSARLEPHLLFSVLLPPLLFEAAVSLPWKPLRENWWPLLLFSLLGTIVAALVVGGLTAWVLRLALPVALVFGALMAPTDPISVLAVFRRLGVHKRLALLVEGESLFNDGVGVVLFTVFVSAVTVGHFSVIVAVLHFVLGIFGGILVGLCAGVAVSWLASRQDDHLLEITLTTLLAYGVFLGAECLGVSGVVAVIIAGLVVRNIWMPRAMSPTSRQAVNAFWEYAAFLANSVIFVLLGNDVAHLHGDFHLWPQVSGAILITLAGRATAVYGLTPLSNRFASRISLNWQHILWWGGLRGALAMALVLGLSPRFPHRDELVLLVYSVVFFSLIVQGISITSLVKRLSGSTKGEAAPAQSW
jgi:CPA1 family monovalent cation:H+ antiporter